MQQVNGRNRVVAYASKLLTGSQKNWVNKVDGISEIECWGVVWSTRKFRCYLDKRDFDLYADHQALTWIFSPGNRTSNAKPRWAMELSNLQFKVYYKPGTAMGHVDGLSRLPIERVAALTMADLLNPSNGPFPENPEPVTADTLETVPEVRFDNDLLVEEMKEDEGDEVPPWESPADPVDEFRLDSEQFIVEQQNVSWIKVLCAFLKDGAIHLDPFLRSQIVKMAPRYKVEEGVLKRRVNLPTRAGHAHTRYVPVVPPSYIDTVLHFCHGDVMSAHLGVTKTLERVRQQAFWPGWRKDVMEFVRECSYCGAGKGSRLWRSGQIQRMPIVDLTGPFSLVVVDAVGPLVSTERNNKYILVFVNYFTRWAKAFAVKRLDTVTFVETLVNGVVSRHRIPSRLLSDRGSNFISDLAKSFYETLGIKKLFGSAYHPQTQGLVERFNGTLIRMLKMYVSEAQEDWDVYLPRVLFAYRTAFHEALGDTPFFSLYGRDPVLPLGEKWKSNEVAQYRRELHKSLRDVRHVVDRQLIKAQDRHEKRLQHQVTAHSEIGDPVWVYQFFRARRGENRIKKLRIVGKVGENAYSVEIPSHPDKVVAVNVNRLKKFRGRWTRPYTDEVPAEVEGEGADDGPLEETYHLRASRNVAQDDTVIAGTDKPLLEIVVKRTINRSVEYWALTFNYETFWLPRSELMPSYGTLVTMFEQAERKKKGLPELRQSSRLADANAKSTRTISLWLKTEMDNRSRL
ncbi:LOW QUALITY PROTEIN: polyprotein [Phytophthora megakarya]|uniref:Polyprotein n=1 Tax=Phytophthora megakarya TaxID=4795 RepID=A0A225VSL4_9STRA|nr:LOW QUALITY PROTEIN: polyprotein [Phytophthora megakarya]